MPELRDLVLMLLRMPESWLQAAVNDWKYPVTRQWMMQATALDVFVQANTSPRKRPKPLERPWPDRNVAKFGGKKNKKRTLAEVLAILRPTEKR